VAAGESKTVDFTFIHVQGALSKVSATSKLSPSRFWF